ncbi:hypothetical protein BHE74_00004639 [Ensete ventricosum]|nr:hypothetical protein BHE74_00004639 [Ensete ventricosum]RZR76879.1 hypothetical protein BHM03_00001767 [Ensete ventricosum]
MHRIGNHSSHLLPRLFPDLIHPFVSCYQKTLGIGLGFGAVYPVLGGFRSNYRSISWRRRSYELWFRFGTWRGRILCGGGDDGVPRFCDRGSCCVGGTGSVPSWFRSRPEFYGECSERKGEGSVEVKKGRKIRRERRFGIVSVGDSGSKL